MVTLKSVRIKVIGKVQGVWYRASTRKRAQELELAGRVRNEADGSVTIEAEGPPPLMDQLIEWAKEGPPHARVDRVEVTEVELKGYEGFEIDRSEF